MSNIRFGGNTGIYKSLFEEHHAGKVVRGVENAVLASFAAEMTAEGGSFARPGKDELERRSRKAFEILGHMRAELGWGIDRIVDSLPRYLMDELSGRSLDFTEERKSWIASDGATPGMRMTDDGEFDLG